METAFGWLAKLRFLRGTALDLFGYTAERRQERADISDYESLLAVVMTELNNKNYDAALALAELPAKLRGFGHVKDRNRDLLALQKQELLQRLRGDTTASPVKIVEAA